MASRTKFYVQNTSVAAGTLAAIATAGTATNLDFILNYRTQSKMTVSALGSAGYANTYNFRLDLGASATLAPFWYGFLGNNFNSVGSIDVSLTTGSTDNGTTWDETTTLVTATPSSSEPLLFVLNEHGYGAKRYFRIKFLNTPTTATSFGNFFMGGESDIYFTSRDPSPNQQVVVSRAGTILNEASGGSEFTVQKHASKRLWRLKWETITDADLTILKNFEIAVGGTLKPFIFTMDNGTTYYYGRMASDLTYSVGVDTDLNDVEFLIREQI